MSTTDRSPYCSRISSNCFVGPGNSSRLRVDRRVSESPSRASRSAWLISSTPIFTLRPFSTLLRNGSGHPPGRSPSSPAMKPITESGMSYLSGFFSKSAGSASAAARARARSPTTFDDGVTFGGRPSITLAAAYRSSIFSKWSARPRAMACWRRLDSWPPGISCL